MGRIRLLDSELIDELASRLRATGAQAVAHKRLSRGEIHESLRGFPGPVPEEAALWWSFWRYGDCLPTVQYRSPSDAMREYEFRRSVSGQARSGGGAPLNPDDMWHPSWLPIFGQDGATLVLDVSLLEGAHAPVRLIDWQNFSGSLFGAIVAPSLGCYIAELVAALDRRSHGPTWEGQP